MFSFLPQVACGASDSQSQCGPRPQPGFDVLSIDHAHGVIGKYFNFDSSAAEAALGRPLQSEDSFSVRNERTGNNVQVVIWNNPNGGSVGDAHGRFISGAAPGQWEVGDRITLLGHGEVAGFEVLSNDHAHGVIGKYFNFNLADAVQAVGRQLSGTNRFRVRNERTGTSALVVVWSNPNGGSVGDAHGRLDSGAAPGDWEVGDSLTLPYLEVLSNDHSSGREGQYFNFDWASAMEALGRQFSQTERITVRNERTGQAGLVVMWGSPNGGSVGDAHGRWDSGAGIGDWEAGDIVTFMQ